MKRGFVFIRTVLMRFNLVSGRIGFSKLLFIGL